MSEEKLLTWFFVGIPCITVALALLGVIAHGLITAV